jgi:hypothetical protein
MTNAKMGDMPLNSAYLCQDCDAVGNSPMYGSACASEALTALACMFDHGEAGGGKNLFLLPASAA